MNWMNKLYRWLKPRLRLWAMYNELGYIPWHKKRKPRKEPKPRKGVYMGTREAIPFMNEDAKRTLSHLLLRPGYMMRDYIMRGQHERYLAPFTALLVFYSVFTLIVAVVKPEAAKDNFGDSLIEGFQNATTFSADSTLSQSRAIDQSIFRTMTDAIILTRLDLHPEAVDTQWKESLAAIESDLRSKGIPLFLGSFLLLWLSMSCVLRKYRISISGAAAAAGYVLCQFCIFMFLALVFTAKHETNLGLLVMGILLLIDYRQLLHIKIKPAFWLTFKTGLLYLIFLVTFYSILGASLIVFAVQRM